MSHQSNHPDHPERPERPHRPLSEISHLFLSSVRKQQTGGQPLPQRTPPRRDVSMDLTPEEFAQVFGGAAPGDEASDDRAPVRALIAGHFNGTQLERVRAYARHLAAEHRRIGLIEVDAGELRISCFDGHGHVVQDAAAPAPEPITARKLTEVLEELGWDVEQWLLCLPHPRTSEARALLRLVPHWTLLCTCDHDGVVSAYRSIKGLADLGRPTLSLGLVDATDREQAERVYRKLSSVCGQFLQWPLDPEPVLVVAHADVTEHPVYCARAGEGAEPGAQWPVMTQFLTSGFDSPDEPVPQSSPVVQEHEKMIEPVVSAEEARHFAHPIVPEPVEPAHREPIHRETPAAAPIPPRSTPAPAPGAQAGPVEPAPMRLIPQADGDDVIELIGDAADETTVLLSIVRHGAGRLIECPVRPPMCPKSILTVNRDRRLVLLAVARHGLGDLRAIGQAYQWLMQNRALIAMAVPQFSIDEAQVPHLSLYVDQRDTSAELLQPMLQSGNVTVQTYRRLRWGGRTGLLLNAA